MAARTQLSFASFNLYNLNLNGLPMYRNRNGWDKTTYTKKINWAASIIKNTNVSAWGFQELWHKKAIEDVFKKANILDDYELLVPDGHEGQRIVCAGAVKKDFLVGSPEWIVNFPDGFKLKNAGGDPQTPLINVQLTRFSRPVLHFKIKPRSNGKTISVYVCHLKSKRPADIYREDWYRGNADYYKKHSIALGAAISTIRRTAEAAALRMIITEELKNTDTPVVVLGDLNDGQHSNTLNIITGQPNYLLSGLSSGGSDTGLYTAGALQQLRSLRNVYYTHIHQNIKESLDHILVSQEFYDNSKKRIWAFKGVEIINDHLNIKDHKKDGSTDHGIVKSSFEYRPAK